MTLLRGHVLVLGSLIPDRLNDTGIAASTNSEVPVQVAIGSTATGPAKKQRTATNHYLISANYIIVISTRYGSLKVVPETTADSGNIRDTLGVDDEAKKAIVVLLAGRGVGGGHEGGDGGESESHGDGFGVASCCERGKWMF